MVPWPWVRYIVLRCVGLLAIDNIVGSREKFKRLIAALLQELIKVIHVATIHFDVLNTAIMNPTLPCKSLCKLYWCCYLFSFNRQAGLDILDDLLGSTCKMSIKQGLSILGLGMDKPCDPDTLTPFQIQESNPKYKVFLLIISRIVRLKDSLLQEWELFLNLTKKALQQ